MQDTTATDNTSLRADGTRVDRMSFDAVYSNRHVTHDTASAMTTGCISTADPRRNFARPRDLPYGSSTFGKLGGQPQHRVSTPYGERRVLPSRSGEFKASTFLLSSYWVPQVSERPVVRISHTTPTVMRLGIGAFGEGKYRSADF